MTDIIISKYRHTFDIQVDEKDGEHMSFRFALTKDDYQSLKHAVSCNDFSDFWVSGAAFLDSLGCEIERYDEESGDEICASDYAYNFIVKNAEQIIHMIRNKRIIVTHKVLISERDNHYNFYVSSSDDVSTCFTLTKNGYQLLKNAVSCNDFSQFAKTRIGTAAFIEDCSGCETQDLDFPPFDENGDEISARTYAYNFVIENAEQIIHMIENKCFKMFNHIKNY